MVKIPVKCFVCGKKFWPATSNDILCDSCAANPDFDDDEPVSQ